MKHAISLIGLPTLVACIFMPMTSRAENVDNGLVESATAPFSIVCNINGDPRYNMGFAWFTSPTVTTGRVEIVECTDPDEADFSSPQYVFEATSTLTPEFTYSVAANKLADVAPGLTQAYMSHKALATGLSPATQYAYRVGNDDGWSATGRFTTAPDQKLTEYSFFYFTDTQALTASQFDVSQRTVHAAAVTVPDACFALCNGDLVESSGANNSEWEYQQWFSTMQDVLLGVPLVVAQGNHDVGPTKNFAWHFNIDNSYNEQADVPTKMPGTVYAFEYGDALFLVVNLNDLGTKGYAASLAAWMREQVAEHSDTKWRILCVHHPIFTGANHQDDTGSPWIRKAMLPLIDELHIDLVIQGHDHVYEVIGPVNNSAMTLEDYNISQQISLFAPASVENMTSKIRGVYDVTDGTLYFLNNCAGAKKHTPKNEAVMDSTLSIHKVPNYWSLFSGRFGQNGYPAFSGIKVTPNELHVTTYSVHDDNTVEPFDDFSVVKNITTILPVADDNSLINYNALDYKIIINTQAEATTSIYALNGVLLLTSDKLEISTANFPPGTYIITVEENHTRHFAKFVID